jgi:hypothetical protein
MQIICVYIIHIYISYNIISYLIISYHIISYHIIYIYTYIYVCYKYIYIYIIDIYPCISCCIFIFQCFTQVPKIRQVASWHPSHHSWNGTRQWTVVDEGRSKTQEKRVWEKLGNLMFYRMDFSMFTMCWVKDEGY